MIRIRGDFSSSGSNAEVGSSSSVGNNGEASSSSGSGADGETVPMLILDENSNLSGTGSTGTHSHDSVSQNPNSTNPQPGAGISTSVTDDISSELVSGSNGINTNEPNQTGDEFSPILIPNTPDGSGLGNTPSTGFGPATGESVNQIISDTSGKTR